MLAFDMKSGGEQARSRVQKVYFKWEVCLETYELDDLETATMVSVSAAKTI